eukprot:TRINITY_DN3235_c0_g1_i2.p2 TRINITY_DN3235_c0_g1~~TRINITY_DN3235_c0_g1_i2.p2  ORF type:complete len:1139 (+),score=449.40 TRINITY_DN3235_c0_g1_i2:55-3471(+)
MAALPSYFDNGAAAAVGAAGQVPQAGFARTEARQQQEQIMTQEVSQAFYHLADAHKRAQGVGEESVAGETEKAKPQLKARGAAARTNNYMSRSGQPTAMGGFKLEFTSGYITFIPELTALFLSCLLPILAVSGRGVLAMLLVGVLASYMFDYTNQKHMALGSVWVCVAAVWAGLFATNYASLNNGSWLNVYIVLNISVYLFLLGLFATIQFRWLQVQYPEVALATERVLLGLPPIACLPLLFSTLVSMAGSQVAPFAYAAVMCGLHRGFYTLRRSAFKEALAPEAKWEEYINGRMEAFFFTVATAVLPCLTFVLTNRAESWVDMRFLFNAGALVAAPLMYLFYDPHSLWFLYGDAYAERRDSNNDHWSVRGARGTVLGVSYSLLLHWLIYRVAFGRFAYLFAGVSPPWNVVLITLGAYAGSVVLYFAVDLAENRQETAGRAMKWTAVLLFSILAAAAVTYAAGMPRFFICCASLSASCLVNFTLDPRNVNNYVLFVCTTLVVLMWWMYHSFSFIHMELPILGGTEYISIPQLAVYILWLYIIQCTLFPLGMAPSGDKAFFVGLLQQVCALAVVEHILYSQTENFYPGLAVLGTTCWGIYFSSTLHHNKRLQKTQCSVLVGLYVAKLYLFTMVTALPDQDSELFKAAYGQYSLVLGFFFAAVLVAIGVQLHWERQEKMRRSSFATLTQLYVFAAVMVAYLSKDSVVLALMELTTGDGEVLTGRLLGLVAVFAGILQFPLTTVLPPSQTRPAKICQGFIVIGALIALLDPQLEGGGEAESLDMDVYEPPLWVPYVGILAVVGVGVTLLGVVALPENSALRIAWWTAVALGCGMSFTAGFIPYPTWHSYLLISLVFGLVVLCIDFTHYSVSAQAESSNSVWGFYSGALVTLLASLVDAQWRVPEAFDPNLRAETSTQRQNSILCLTIGINLVLAALIKLKLTDRPALRPRTLAKLDSLRDAQGDGSHFGLLANICAVQAYLSLIMLRNDIGSTSPSFYVMIAPLLLLMHDDGLVFYNISDPDQLSRYVPPMLTSLAALSWRVMWAELPMLINRSPAGFAMQLTVFLLSVAIGASAAYDMWIDSGERRKEGGTDAVVVGTVTVLLLLAGTESIRLIAGVTLIACVLPVFNDSAWAKKLSAVL